MSGVTDACKHQGTVRLNKNGTTDCMTCDKKDIYGIIQGELFIVKLQWPISTNMEIPEVLVYNEDESIFQGFPISQELKEMFGNKLKIYRMAQIRRDGVLEVFADPVLEEQEW